MLGLIYEYKSSIVLTMSKKVLTLQRILVLCGQLCPAVKREPGENPGQTTLLCFPLPSCSTHSAIVTVSYDGKAVLQRDKSETLPLCIDI